MEKLNLSGKGTASDFELDKSARVIFEELRIFDSPKDAACALALAHLAMIRASFPPEYKANAIRAIEGHCEMLKQFLNEGWQ